jgi:hypothetical protein
VKRAEVLAKERKPKKTEILMSVLMAPFADDSDPRDDVDLESDPDALPDFDRDDYAFGEDDFYGDYPDYADYDIFGNE